MHLLGSLSLGCYLAAAAVVLLLGAPEPAAAYESGQGYYEEEPDLGEAKEINLTFLFESAVQKILSFQQQILESSL
uniref:Uncharacterized protein n=1 Tax=Sphaerodactylus townsendi TaxID=933632 RepID=A0ACB8E7K6_9SAUR